MCGIIGYTGKRDAVPVILEGLKRLEYRGYDSAGIAYFIEDRIEVKRRKGKIRELGALLEGIRLHSHTAIGHTRWATHGRPSEENAHPHRSDHIVLVHNGIIENFIPLKKELAKKGFKFKSETDTEVICHLIRKHSDGRPLEEAVRKALDQLRGSYAIAVMSEKEPGKIVGARKDSPLVTGIDEEGGGFIASDIPAFLNYSREVVFLEDGDMVVMTPRGVSFMKAFNGAGIRAKPVHIAWSASMAEKGGYRHFMLKEIFEQPRAIADTIRGRVNAEAGRVNLKEFGLDRAALKDINKVFIAACGTSWHAGLLGKYMMEKLARLPVEVDIASEFRYRNPIIGSGDLFISLTQSGETADTLAAQRLAKKAGAKVLSICNVMGSTSAREADGVFYTRSGPEIGVASTKSFTCQIVGLYLLALALGASRGLLKSGSVKKHLEELLSIPDKIEKILRKNAEIEKLSRNFIRRESFLYLGRGINYPIALEGALKLKEISYIHAEAYPAGEIKHGPIALVDEGYPVLFLAPGDGLFEKVLSNMQEIKSRGGKLITLVTETAGEASALSEHIIRVPASNEYLTPLLLSVPLQLMAYHIGVLRGHDVDQPRNLAKSVTVE